MMLGAIILACVAFGATITWAALTPIRHIRRNPLQSDRDRQAEHRTRREIIRKIIERGSVK